MEIAGLAIGVAGLVSLCDTCQDLLGKVAAYRHHDVEAQRLTARFDSDKLRFDDWVRDNLHDPERAKSLDTDKSRASAIYQVLMSVQNLLSSIERKLLPLQQTPSGKDLVVSTLQMRKLVEQKQPQNPSSRSSASRLQRFQWSLKGRADLIPDVESFGIFVDKLHQLTHTAKRQATFELQVTLQLDELQELISRIICPGTIETTASQILFDSFREERLEGTCEWIFQHPSYLDWISPVFQQDTAKLLWIHAPAGFGKSVTCAKIIETLSESPQFPLAYFFCSSGAEYMQDPLVIIRAWVQQMISQNILPRSLKSDQVESRNLSENYFKNVFDVFRSILIGTPSRTFVVDGLDEISGGPEVWKPGRFMSRERFIERLKDTVAQTQTRLLIVSRNESDIRQQLSARNDVQKGIALSELEVSVVENRNDIRKYANNVVSRKLSNKSEELRVDIASKVSEKCEGMFLWIKLQEPQLRGGKNRKQLQALVDDLPSGLDHAYARSWQNVLSQPISDRARAESILRWVAFAKRPLTVDELTEALLIPGDDEDTALHDFPTGDLPDSIDEEYIESELLSLSKSFITLQNSKSDMHLGSKTVHFIHFSAKEYLLSPGEEGPFANHSYQQNLLARQCLRYLNYPRTWEESADKADACVTPQAFRAYACSFWPDHLMLGESGSEQSVHVVNKFFQTPNSHWEKWRDVFESTYVDCDEEQLVIESPGGRLHYAARFGLVDTVESIVATGLENIDSPGSLCGTPLQAACIGGDIDIIQSLIDKGANINAEGGEFGSAVNAAAALGHIEAVEFLLKLGASLDKKDRFGRTALHLACQRNNLKIVERLLREKANTLIKYDDGLSPLHGAAMHGHYQIVELLLDHSSEVSSKEKSEGRTPLHLAARNGHLDVTQLLLNRGAEASCTDNDGWTPLHMASQNGHLDVAQHLLVNGAEASCRSNDGKTPLHLAALVDISQLLLSNGVQVSCTDNDQWTPLHFAARNGHLDVAQLLINHGAEVSCAESGGWTPLHLAAKYGHLEILQALLEKGASPITRHPLGWMPIHSAVEYGHLEITQVLLDNNAGVSCVDRDGWMPLYIAAQYGHLEVLQLLLERGASPTVSDADGWTPIHGAAMNGHLEIVQTLIDQGAQVSISDTKGWRPIHGAAEKGHLEITQVLLDNNAEVSCTEKHGWTPVHFAAQYGHLEVLRLLLERGASPAVSDVDGWTPIHGAAMNGHLKVVQTLIDKGAQVSISNNKGWTPIHCAVRYGHLEITHVLLNNNAEASCTEKHGWTPIHLAAQCGHLEVLQLLLERGASPTVNNAEGWTPIHGAADNGNLKVVQILIDQGAQVSVSDTKGLKPIHGAAQNGHLEVVQLLLETGASPAVSDVDGWTPIHDAAENGHLEILQLLLEGGASPTVANIDGWTPLHCAAHKGHLDVIQILIDRGVQPSISDNYGTTPLHSAAFSGNTAVVMHLINCGVDISLPDSNECSPLFLASHGEHILVAELLLAHGARLEQPDGNGWTPVHVATAKGNRSMVHFLVEKGADLNLAAKDGTTPLHIAMQRGHLDCATTLTEHGAVSSIKDIYGRTPSDWNCDLVEEHLMDQLRGVVDQLRGVKLNDRGFFDVLGRSLLKLSEPSLASLAFARSTLLFRGSKYEHITWCDLCGYRICNVRYICTVCLKTDLCENCMGEYESTGQLSWCRSHEFHKFSPRGLTPYTPPTHSPKVDWIIPFLESTRSAYPGV